jgi:hypothetical protein
MIVRLNGTRDYVSRHVTISPNKHTFRCFPTVLYAIQNLDQHRLFQSPLLYAIQTSFRSFAGCRGHKRTTAVTKDDGYAVGGTVIVNIDAEHLHGLHSCLSRK